MNTTTVKFEISIDGEILNCVTETRINLYR